VYFASSFLQAGQLSHQLTNQSVLVAVFMTADTLYCGCY